MIKAILVLSFALMSGLTASAQNSTTDWQTKLQQMLPLLGHRNWIMIVDSAYPLQSTPGVETIETNLDQVAVIHKVMAAINGSIHVRPVIYMDAELPFVADQDAPGVSAYRHAVQSMFAGQKITSLPHEQIIAKVAEVGKTFNVLILKTTMTVPYSSVFLELRCKYWSDEAETQLRKDMAQKERSK